MNAVVVGWTDVGEADRIIRLLSETRGQISLYASRVRRPSSGLAPKLEMGNEVVIEVRRGRSGLDRLASVEVTRVPRGAREDLLRMAYLAYGCELCARLAPENAAAPMFWGMLTTWLRCLDELPEVGVTHRVALEAKCLTFAGLLPRFFNCVHCGEPVVQDIRFSDEEGGVLHSRCGGGVKMMPESLVQFESLRRAPLKTIERGLVHEKWVLSAFVESRLEAELKTKRLLVQVEEDE